MKLRRIAPFLIIVLLLAACSSGTATPVESGNSTASATQSNYPTQPAPATLPDTSKSYPAPVEPAVVPTTSAYPAPGQPGSSPVGMPPSGYEPQSGDDSLTKDKVTLDMTVSKVVVIATQPAQASAVLTGSMADPCHSLRVVVTPADANNIINIEAYSLYDSNSTCVVKEEPFNATIPLGSYASGQYTVNVNSERLGAFQAVFAPQPDDGKLTQGDAMLDMKASSVIQSTTPAGSAGVELTGSLSDPCHQLRIVMTPADAQRNIKLDVYSVYDSTTACITVIQPFDVIFPLENLTSGQYAIFVNGEQLGKLNIQ